MQDAHSTDGRSAPSEVPPPAAFPSSASSLAGGDARARELQAHEARLRADVGSALTRERTLRGALQRSAEAIVRHVDAAFARVWTLSADGQTLELQASAGIYTHIDGGHARVPVGALKIGGIAKSKKPHLTNDVQHDPRVGDHAWAKREGLVSFAGYPLVIDGRLMGVAALFGRTRLDEETLDVLSGVADLMALSIDRVRTEESLAETAAHLRLFAEATNEGIWSWDLRSGKTEWNDRVLAILGLARGEWDESFDSFFDFVSTEDAAKIKAALNAHLEHGAPYEVSFAVRRRTGDVRYCIVRGKAMRDAAGKPLLMAGGIYDNTAKVLAEVQIAAAHARAERERQTMREMFMGAPAAIAMMRRSGKELQFEFANPVYEKLIGRTGIVGRNAREVMPEITDEVWSLTDRVIDSGEPFVANEFPVELLRADGKMELGYFTGVTQPLRDADGCIQGAVSFSVEVTDQVRAREVLREREEQLRQLVENLPELAWSALADGSIDYYNSRWYEYTGTTFEEMQGWGWKSVHDPSMLGAVIERWTQSINSGEPFEMEFPLRGKDGVFRWFLTRVNPLRDASGKVIRWFGMNTNIEERKRSEAERERLIGALAASNAELDQFAYVASHDLKAPLRGIANLSQWIEEDLGDRMVGESRENMALLRGRVHRLEQLIDGILSYSRAGRVRDRAEEIETGAMVKDLVELMGVSLPASVVVRGEMPVLIAERVPLSQVFMNLIGNALKHAGKKDVRVEISAQDLGAAWQITVKDDGAGIASAFHERIWGIFQTLQPRDRVEGTGIGLSVVKKIVESRGGRVSIESDEGRGAAFRFTWPKKPRDSR